MTVVGQQLISSVRAYAALTPDFVYKSPFDDQPFYGTCLYVHNGKGSCLIGQALMDAGLIGAEFEVADYNNYPITELVDDVLNLKLDREQRLWLRDVQYRQDARDPWGEAVAHADRNALERILA